MFLIKLFIDSVAVDMLKSETVLLRLVKSQTELINMAVQAPVEFLSDSTIQAILITTVGACTVTANLTVIKLLNDIITLLASGGGSSSTECNIRQYFHLLSNGLVNVSWEASNVVMIEGKERLVLTWPQGRVCTSGMSNLSTDVELPAFIALPIHLVQGKISTK